jgi:hypothetical protein
MLIAGHLALEYQFPPSTTKFYSIGTELQSQELTPFGQNHKYMKT